MQNFHPLLVHFPIALILMAAFFELLHRFTRDAILDRLALWLLCFGGLAAAFAAASGWIAEQTVAPVAAAHEVLEHHRMAGYLTLGLAAAQIAWRIATGRRGGPRPRWLFAVALLGLAGLVAFAAHQGGQLVYQHGVGTAITAPGGPLAEDPTTQPEKTPAEVPTGKDFR